MLLLFTRLPYEGPNAAYAAGVNGLLDGTIDLTSVNLACVLVDMGVYIPDFGTDDTLDDIPSAARISTSANLTSVAVTDGTVTADDAAFTAVSGATVEAMVLYVNTGSASTSTLLAFYSEIDVFPYTPSGADLTVEWAGGEVLIASDVNDWPYVRSVGITGFSTGSGVSVVLDDPPEVEEGDLLIAVFAHRFGSTDLLSGWSWLVTPVTADDTEAGLFMAYKVATDSEPSTYTWTETGGVDRIGQIFAIANTTGVPTDVTEGSIGTSTVAYPEVTPGAPRALWVGLIAANTASNTSWEFEYWTVASKVMAGFQYGYRLGVGAAVARVDNGAAETTLGVTCVATHGIDRTLAFAVVAP